MSKLKIGLYLAAIFAAGFVTGVFVTVQVARRMMPDQAQMAARWCKDLQSKMSLSPTQVEKIRPVINVTLNDLRNRLYAMALTIFGGGTNEPHKRP